MAARARGLDILDFLKRGGTPDDTQQAFIDRVSGYVDGRFRKGFADVAGLLTAVTGAIRELESRPPVLAWTALTVQVDVPWREAGSNTFGFSGTELETYLMPVGPIDRLLATQLTGFLERLGRAARDEGLFAQGGALNLYSTADEAVAAARRESRAADAGIRVGSDRSIAIWEHLPTDMLGAIVDEQDLAARMAKALRFSQARAHHPVPGFHVSRLWPEPREI